MSQLNLALGRVDAPADHDFVVGDANARAAHMLEHWGRWPVMAALLIGPRKSGRSLLARIFESRSGGTVIDNAEIQPEERIFHAWNKAQSVRSPLLIVANAAPPIWHISLPDLRSRLTATPVIQIEAPDDALMTILLRRKLDQRALYARGELLTWLARRVERSYIAIERIVDVLEADAQQRGNRRLTIPTARNCLAITGLLIKPANESEEA